MSRGDGPPAEPAGAATLRAARGLLVASGLILWGFAIVLLVDPAQLGQWVGMEYTSPEARVEVYAFYVGLELGLGTWLLWAAARAERVRTGLWMVVLAFGATGLFRGIGCLAFGVEGLGHPAVAALELGFAGAAAWLRGRLQAGPWSSRPPSP